MIARMLVFVSVALVLCTSAFAQKGQYAVPDGAEIEKYPVIDKLLTTEQQVSMGLRLKKLDSPTVVENHFRGLHGKEGRFVLETLPTGTLVFVSDDGKIRYKTDCGNRLVEIVKAEIIEVLPPPAPLPAPGPGFWQRFTDAMRAIAQGVWNLLAPFGWLVLALLGIGFLVLLIYLLYRLLNWLFNRPGESPRTAETGFRPAPVVPTPGQPASGQGGLGPQAPPPPPLPAPPVAEVPKAQSEIPSPVEGTVSFEYKRANDGQPAMVRMKGIEVEDFNFSVGPEGTTLRYREVKEEKPSKKTK